MSQGTEIRRVGNVGTTFEITLPGGRSFRVRTTSPRRYLVIDVRGGYVEVRTDKIERAEQVVRNGAAGRYMILDRRMVTA